MTEDLETPPNFIGRGFSLTFHYNLSILQMRCTSEKPLLIRIFMSAL